MGIAANLGIAFRRVEELAIREEVAADTLRVSLITGSEGRGFIADILWKGKGRGAGLFANP